MDMVVIVACASRKKRRCVAADLDVSALNGKPVMKQICADHHAEAIRAQHVAPSLDTTGP